VSEPDWVLLERVAVGKGSAADRAAVEQWIAGDHERQRLFESLGRIAEGTRRLTIGPSFDPAPSLARVRARLSRKSNGWRVERRLSDRWPMMAIAAALVVCAGVGLTLAKGQRREAPVQSYVTARGQRATLHLDDGTQVILAPASHLSVVGRTATLDGEAYFTVVHDPRAPFVVHAGRAVATDIGTRFDVRAYPEDSTVSVAVEDGQVSVATAGAPTPIPLARGDVAMLAVSTTAVNHGVEPSRISAWTSGRLEFHGTPMREAVVALSRWYDVDLRLGDSTLAALPLTASFRDEPVDEVLHIVAVTVGARVHWSERTVFLRKK
jgi:transmembrane sensor